MRVNSGNGHITEARAETHLTLASPPGILLHGRRPTGETASGHNEMQP